MIAGRFLPVICALVGVTLVPTLIHSYGNSTLDDGRSTARMSATLAGYPGTRSSRDATWGRRRFESFDWTERLYKVGPDDVKVSVIRSYDAKTLYHHPELAVAYGPSYVSTDVRRFPQKPDVPVHVLSTAGENRTVAMYVLHYDDRFVEDPILFQIRNSGELLFSRRKPMTLLFVTDTHTSPGESAESLPGARLLVAAIDQFLASNVSKR